MRAVPRLCEFYLGICLTTEEKARKNLSGVRKTSVRLRKTSVREKNLSQGKKNVSQVKKDLSQREKPQSILYVRLFYAF